MEKGGERDAYPAASLSLLKVSDYRASAHGGGRREKKRKKKVTYVEPAAHSLRY